MSSLSQRWIAVGALFGALGVAFGAYGAHGLADFLEGLGYEGDDLSRRIKIYNTAVHYQMLHAMAIVIIGLGLEHRASTWWRFAAWAFLVGILLFSGSLYIVATLGIGWVGAITPIGGVAFLCGWALMILAFWRRLRTS